MSSPNAESAAPSGLRAYAYRSSWRAIAGVLVAVGHGSLLAIAAWLLATEEPVTVARLGSLVVAFALLPQAAAGLVRRALVARVTVEGGQLVVERPGWRLDVPVASIAALRPWRMPLPGPGLGLRLRSGRGLPYGLETRDPLALVDALTDGGADVGAAAREHPVVVYAHAKARSRERRWWHRLGKFVVFPLVPTAVWFNAHQHIAYGGLLGQYYLEGLRPYLTTLVVSWGLAACYVLLYAAVARAAVEAVDLLTAAVAPSLAARVRRAAEITLGVVYYGGIPALVVLPFLR